MRADRDIHSASRAPNDTQSRDVTAGAGAGPQPLAPQTRSLAPGVPVSRSGPSPADTAELRVVCGSGARRHFKLEGNARIGRSAEAEVSLDEPEVSRFHARIHRMGDGSYEIEDLGSKNGTLVNGKRIDRARLTFGDNITIGRKTLIEFERFDLAADELRKRDRLETVGRLGLGIAHDLNNVLGVLVAGTSYLQDLPPNRTLGHAEVMECISDLALAAGRAADLANSVLCLAKDRNALRTTVDLSALVQEVVRLLRRVVDPRIAIEVSAPEKVLVYAVWSELHQVVMNLCLNARDAMPQGGNLRITTAAAPAGMGVVGATRGTSAAILTVADSGHGIDPAIRTRVFEPLFTTKQTSASYGLGLATVHEIVTRHAGRVTVDSEVGKGSVFTLYLPRLSEEATRQSGTKEGSVRTAVQLQGGPLRVLLVDDEDIVRRSVTRQLRSIGVDVTDVADGAEALLQYQPGTFDLVVIDLDAPGFQGIAGHVLLSRTDPDVRIALVAGGSETRRLNQARTPGVIEILPKPYRVDSIIELAINCRIGRPAAYDEAPTHW